jgi:hypothetical protein
MNKFLPLLLISLFINLPSSFAASEELNVSQTPEIETREITFDDLNEELRYYQKQHVLRFHFSLGMTTTHITEESFASITGAFGPEIIVHASKFALGFGAFMMKPFTKDEKSIRGYDLGRILFMPNLSFLTLNESILIRLYTGLSINNNDTGAFSYGLGLGFRNQISQYNDLGLTLTYLHTHSASAQPYLFSNQSVEWSPYFSSFILSLDFGFQL